MVSWIQRHCNINRLLPEKWAVCILAGSVIGDALNYSSQETILHLTILINMVKLYHVNHLRPSKTPVVWKRLRISRLMKLLRVLR